LEDIITHVISGCDNWNNLNKKLLDLGLVNRIYEDRCRFVSLIQTVWSANASYAEQVDCFPLPGKKIVSGNIEFFIHGLPHNTHFFNISQDFKSLINEKLLGLNTVCEDGFYEWIPDAVSFREIEYFNLNQVNYFETLKAMILMPFYRLNNKVSKNHLIEKVKNIRTIEDLIRIRELLFKGYLPEPLELNAAFYLAGSGTLDKPIKDIPFVVRRYAYEAGKAIEYAENSNLRELHIVVGCRHERPLEYLITHHNILESYK
jgi:hypothetical protein